MRGPFQITLHGTHAAAAQNRFARGMSLQNVDCNAALCWSAEFTHDARFPIFVRSTSCRPDVITAVDADNGRLARRGIVEVFAPAGWTTDPSNGPDTVIIKLGDEDTAPSLARLSEWYERAFVGTITVPPGAYEMWCGSAVTIFRNFAGAATAQAVPPRSWVPASAISVNSADDYYMQWRIQ